MPGGWEMIAIVGVIVLLFGGAKLPKLARSLGQAQNEFKTGLAEGEKPDVAPVADKSDDVTKS